MHRGFLIHMYRFEFLLTRIENGYNDNKMHYILFTRVYLYQKCPPATPAVMPTIPLAFGANPSQKKKGRQRKPAPST
jgi:hypothetical protein